MMDLWNHEDPCTNYGIEVPQWIDQDISPCTVASLVQSGCASGAYMTSVFYDDASRVMEEHGDAVLQYLEDEIGEVPPIGKLGWSGYKCCLLSAAVEAWAILVLDQLECYEPED